jgi:hypothetical protein
MTSRREAAEMMVNRAPATPSVPRILGLEDIWASEHIIVPRDALRKVADEFHHDP